MNLKIFLLLKNEIINKSTVKISIYSFFNNKISPNTVIFVSTLHQMSLTMVNFKSNMYNFDVSNV